MIHLQQKRHGMVLIMMLVCLAIASVLLIVGVKLAVTSHSVTRNFGWMAQSQLLVESGLQRAAAQLASDADYSGETWKIPAADLGGSDAGLVKIEVKTVADKSNRRLVNVEADFPDDPQDRVRYQKELTLEIE
jgi:hypothetical protein